MNSVNLLVLPLDDSDTCELTVACDLATHNQRTGTLVYFRRVGGSVKENRNLCFDIGSIVKLEMAIFVVCDCYLNETIF